jgi:hypothetical protein
MIIETTHPSSKIAADHKSDISFTRANSNKLSPADAESLARCESIIAAPFTTDSVMRIGLALAEILEKKLYRDRFQTFADYCLHCWKISRFHARRQINAAKTLQHLLTLGTIPLPKTERQLRPLTSLPPAKAQETWKEILKTAKNQQITVGTIEEAVLRFKRRRAGKSPGPEPWQDLLKPILRKALNATIQGDREKVVELLTKASLLVEVGRSTDQKTGD